MVLLSLIFIRPFISSLAFPYLNIIYSAILLIFLASWIIIKKISFQKISSFKYPLILFCLALVISVVFSLNKINSFRELYKYITGLLLFIIAASLDCKDRIRIIHTLVIAGFVISILAICQYFFGFTHTLEYLANNNLASSFILDYYIQYKRAFLPFVTPNTLAGYLTMLIPLALINKNRIWLILPLSFALLLTKSLGALLSLFLASGLYFYLEGSFKKRRIILLSVLVLIIGVLFIIRTITQEQYLQPISSSIMRLNYWKDTLEIIKAKPLTGVGIGNFNLKLSRYVHNSYLQIWAEMGIFGITSFLWLLTYILKSALKNLKVSLYKDRTIALFAATAAFLTHNFVDFTFFLPEVSLLWWMILGMKN